MFVSFSNFIDKYELNEDLKNFPELYTLNPSSPYNKKWNIEYVITHADTIYEQNENNNAIIRGEKRKKERILSELIPIKNEDLVNDISFQLSGIGVMEAVLYILDNRYLSLEDYQKKEYLKTFIVYMNQINNSQKNLLFKTFFEKKINSEKLNRYQVLILLNILSEYLEVNFKVDNVLIKKEYNAWMSLEFIEDCKIKAIINSIVSIENIDISKCKDFILITKKNTMVDIITICNEWSIPIKSKPKKDELLKIIYEE
jgi:hypothetical protein